MVACNDYTSCLPDCVSGMAYDLLAASALLERLAVVVETVSTQDCYVKFSLREKIRRAGIIFSLRWDFSGWEARGKKQYGFRLMCATFAVTLTDTLSATSTATISDTRSDTFTATDTDTFTYTLGDTLSDTYGDTFGDTFTDTFSTTFSVSVRHLFRHLF